MADVETPPAPEPRALPQVMMGAASPLWAYFGAAAAGGLAYWWMTRWTRSVNLEAMLAPATAALEPLIEAVEAIAELPYEAVEALAEAEPGPIELEPVAEAFPTLAAASDAPAEAATVAEPEPVAAPEPVVEAAASVEVADAVVELAPEPVLEAKVEPVEVAPAPYDWAEPEVTLGFEPPAAEALAAAKPKARKAATPKA